MKVSRSVIGMRRDHRIEDGVDSLEERRAEIKRLTWRLGSHSSRLRVAAAAKLVEFGPDALEPLRDALYLPEVDVQVAAAEGLCKLGGTTAGSALLPCLSMPKAAVRTAAALALGKMRDTRATDGLIDLLKDPDIPTRAAAATALGDLGQESAIPPLMAAYHECFVGRSARTQRFVGPAMVGMLVLAMLLLFWGTFAARIGGLMGLFSIFVQIGIRYFAARQVRSKVVGAITEALVKIAERNPRPELHCLIPELRAVAQDRMQQAKATRVASLLAADRIEALTSALHDLPVPSGTPTLIAASLPQPAEAPQVLSSRSGG